MCGKTSQGHGGPRLPPSPPAWGGLGSGKRVPSAWKALGMWAQVALPLSPPDPCLSLSVPIHSFSMATSAMDSPSHHPEIRRLFPGARMQTVPNAGHWVHADRPQDFMAAVQGFLV